MSDLRPQGVKVEIGGQERTFLFSLNAIDEIQEACNMPLIDAMKKIAEAIDGNAQDHEALVTFRTVVTSLINGSGDEPLTEDEVGQMIHIDNYKKIGWKVLEAYGISIPDPDDKDEEDEDEEEEEDPNLETGQ